jgi:hypothetical protein
MIYAKFLTIALLVNFGLAHSSLSADKEIIIEIDEASLFQDAGNELEIQTNAISRPCLACYAAIPLIKELIIKNDTRGFKDIAIFVCVALKIADDQEVCNQAIELFEPAVLSVIKNTALTDIELCSAFISCGPIRNPAFTWNIFLPNVPKPPVRPLTPPSVI